MPLPSADTMGVAAGRPLLPGSSLSSRACPPGPSAAGTTRTPLDDASGLAAAPCQAPSSSGEWRAGGLGGLQVGPSWQDERTCDNSGSAGQSSGGPGCSWSSPSAGLRGCDVYIGVCGGDGSVLRFVKWLRAELESHGVHCFVSDRSASADSRAREVAREAMDLATLGVVVITRKTFSSAYGMQEVKLFLDRSNLVPIFFGLSQKDCLVGDIMWRRGELWKKCGRFLWEVHGGLEQEWMEAVEKLSRLGCKLEAGESNMRDCILDSVVLIGRRLGRRGIVEEVKRWKESVAKMEHPFPRNDYFVGRKQELHQLELALFGHVQGDECLNVGRRSEMSPSTRSTVGGVSPEPEGRSMKSIRLKELGNNAEKEGCSGDKERDSHHVQIRNSSSLREQYGKGIACVCGESGIGKTELLLEFTYKFSQRYKMVLWVGGEAKYLRLNYLNLLSPLGVDVSKDVEAYLEVGVPRNFKDAEEQAIRRVRKELTRDIPFLLVIDNLESEKDWWDGRNIMELLPRGGETHVIISTCMPKVMNFHTIRLSYLSHAEALILVMGRLGDLPTEEVDALNAIEEKLGRLPLSLAIFGAILSEIPINPRRLLDTIERMPLGNHMWSDEEDHVLKKYPSVVQLLDLCFVMSDLADKHNNLAFRMVQASGWFAPSPIPINLLFTAASEIVQDHHCVQSLKKFLHVVKCMCMISNIKEPELEASRILVRLRIARNCTKDDCIHFHDIIKKYGRKKGKSSVALAMVHSILHKGSVHHHPEHVWAASFLLFMFGNNPPTVSLRIPELVAFINKFILPLARNTFTSFSRCEAALELLFASDKLLKDLEDTILEENNSLDRHFFREPLKSHSTIQFDHYIYKEFALLRCTILETRAEMMLKGGWYDIAERLCQSAINIKEVFYGCEHSETMFTKEIMVKLVRLQSKS